MAKSKFSGQTNAKKKKSTAKPKKSSSGKGGWPKVSVAAYLGGDKTPFVLPK